jgi:hypothetical protein
MIIFQQMILLIFYLKFYERACFILMIYLSYKVTNKF